MSNKNASILKEKVLFIGHIWPEPTSSAAGSRMMQLIQLFLKQKHHVFFCSPASLSEFSVQLKDYGIETDHVNINDGAFNNYLKKIQPDIVVFDRFMTEEKFGWRVAENCPDAIRILDTEDLHCLRFARQESVQKNIPFSINSLKNEIAKREIASILRCDISLIISEFEIELLKQVFKIESSILLYLPFLIDINALKKPLQFEERSNFISIGNFLHPPNKDAVIQLKKHIWPKIKKNIPDAELNIFGSYMPDDIVQLNNKKEGFIIKGRANDAFKELSNHKALLAPLRFGAGLKGKLIEAMQCGTPSITTDIGSEGMMFDLEWNGFIENDFNAFSESAIKIYTERAVWEKSLAIGFKILRYKFDMNLHSNIFLECIMKIRKNIKKHREENFMGALFLHHQFHSTKYFSKWIEEKNKKGL